MIAQAETERDVGALLLRLRSLRPTPAALTTTKTCPASTDAPGTAPGQTTQRYIAGFAVEPRRRIPGPPR